MYSDQGWIIMFDCTFNLNTADNDGGIMRSYLSKVNVSESTFVGNEVKAYGGVYHIEQSDLKISNHSIFKGSSHQDDLQTFFSPIP